MHLDSCFETNISRRLGEQMFVYLLLMDVTLQAGNAQCYIMNILLLGEYYFRRSPSLRYGLLITHNDKYIRDGGREDSKYVKGSYLFDPLHTIYITYNIYKLFKTYVLTSMCAAQCQNRK